MKYGEAKAIILHEITEWGGNLRYEGPGEDDYQRLAARLAQIVMLLFSGVSDPEFRKDFGLPDPDELNL